MPAGGGSAVVQSGLSEPRLSEMSIPSRKRMAWHEVSETLRSLKGSGGGGGGMDYIRG